jgi:tetratricopeptide (TPR) repeat protein/transcriptional regulator with XRE-family HTH domain
MTTAVLADLLRGYRSTARLSREALAERAELSVEAIRALENGRRRYPRPATLEQLSAALHLAEADRLLLEQSARRPAAATAGRRELPADLADFVGRERAVESLVDSLTGTPGAPGAVILVAIAGMGGIGKTALAVRAAQRTADAFPDGQLYVNLGGHGGGDPATPLEVLGRILRSFGAAAADVPDDLATAAARYRAVLAGRRVLVLLDDAAGSAQVEPLLPGTAGSVALITSRRRLTGLAGARHLALDLFSEAEALHLLDSLVENRAAEEPEAAREVVRLCGRLPLALRIAGTYLADRPGQTLAQLAAELADEHAKLGVLSPADAEAGVRSSLGLSVDALAAGSRPVDQAAARALPLVSLLPGDDFSLRVAAAAVDLPLDQVEAALEHLVDVNLLETPALQRYRLHDLIRAVGRELAISQTTEADRADLRLRVLDQYLAVLWRIDELDNKSERRTKWRDPLWSSAAMDLADLDSALDVFDADRANLLVSTRVAVRGSAAEQLRVIRIAPGSSAPCRHRRRWLEWSELNRLAAGLIDDQADPLGAEMIHFDLGLADAELGEFERGGEHLAKAHSLAVQLGDEEYEGKSLMNLAHTLERSNRLAEGREAAGRSLAHALRTGNEDIESFTRLVLGQIAGKEGDLETQLASFRSSVKLIKQFDWPSLVAMQHLIAGESYREAGQFDDAVSSLQQAREIYRETDSLAGLAEVLDHFGAVAFELGQYDEALARHQEALTLALGNQLWDREANIRVRMGQTLAALGRPDEARAEWQSALRLYESHGSSRSDRVRTLLTPP